MPNAIDIKKYRHRLGYFLASLFVIWQSLVIIIGPSPTSYTMNKIYPVFEPYLTLFHLDNNWAFFAEDPARGTMVHYSILDENNQRHDFPLSETLQRSNPAFSRYTSLFDAIADNNKRYVTSTAQYLCKQHEDLGTRWLTFVLRKQKPFTIEDYRQGRLPLEDAFIRERRLPTVKCASGGKS